MKKSDHRFSKIGRGHWIARLGLYAGVVLVALIAGCSGGPDAKLISEVRHTDWYTHAAGAVRRDENFPRVLGYTAAIVAGVITKDVVCPKSEVVMVPLKLNPFETLVARRPISSDPMWIYVGQGDFPDRNMFRRGSLWSFLMITNSKGDWYVRSKKRLRQAEPAVGAGLAPPKVIQHNSN